MVRLRRHRGQLALVEAAFGVDEHPLAVEAGALIAIDTDAHRPRDFDHLRYGVMTGRRGWLPAERCVNTWDAERLMAWVTSKR